MLIRNENLLSFQWTRDTDHLCIFGLLYYIAVVVGLESRVEALALFWPANGVAFGFFLIKSPRLWLHYTAMMSLGYVIGMHATGDYSWATILGALMANIIQTVSGAGLVRYFLPGKITFATVKEIITILFLTSVVGSIISASFFVGVLGSGFMKTPFEFWASGMIDNAGSTIMTLPLVLLLLLTNSNFSFKNILKHSNTYKTIEFLLLLSTTFILTEYVFGIETSTSSLTRTLPYLLLPCVLWSALRFSGITVAMIVMFIGTEAVRHTVMGEGPFSDTYSGFILVVTLHLYISVTMITGLLFSALIKQQQMVMYSLAGSIAHEVRTPLSQVLYQLYKLEQLYENKTFESAEEKKDSWQDTKHTVLHGLQVVDMMLNETKGNLISLGNLEYLSAKDATLSAIESYAYKNQYEKSRVKVKVDKDFTLKIERMLFDHILFNLLKNALYYISYYPKADIAVTVKADVYCNMIEVQDTGPGIDKDKIPMLFNEFYSDKKNGGTGLGLSYCKRTMKAFGGNILCDSVKEEYTKFTLVFPKIKGKLSKAHSSASKFDQSMIYQSLKGKTILYVDDEEINHMILNEAFDDIDVNIINVFSADDALNILRKGKCDAIIADLNMPYKSGIDLVREIRRSDNKLGVQTIPVIGLGGDPSSITMRACIEAGMNVYLHKPLNKIKLTESLYRFLDRNVASSTVTTIEKDDAPDEMPSGQQDVYDTAAGLMHDLATPIATMNMCYELLREYLDDLIERYHRDSGDLNHKQPSLEQIKWLADVPEMYVDLARATRKRADNFWGIFSEEMHSIQMSMLVDFVTKLSKSWAEVERNNARAQSAVKTLIEFYKKKQSSESSEPGIPEQKLKKLSDTVQMCANAVSRVDEKLRIVCDKYHIS